MLFGYFSIVPVLDFMLSYIAVCKTKDPVSLRVCTTNVLFHGAPRSLVINM